jgi:hypothetical protein
MIPKTHSRPMVSLGRQRQAVELLLKHHRDGLKKTGLPESQMTMIVTDAEAVLRTLAWIEKHKDAIYTVVREVP